MRRFLALALLCASLPSCLGECQAVRVGAIGGGAIGTGQVGAGAIGGPSGTAAAAGIPDPPGAPLHWYAARLDAAGGDGFDYADAATVTEVTDWGSLPENLDVAASNIKFRTNQFGADLSAYDFGTSSGSIYGAGTDITDSFVACLVYMPPDLPGTYEMILGVGDISIGTDSFVMWDQGVVGNFGVRGPNNKFAVNTGKMAPRTPEVYCAVAADTDTGGDIETMYLGTAGTTVTPTGAGDARTHVFLGSTGGAGGFDSNGWIAEVAIWTDGTTMAEGSAWLNEVYSVYGDEEPTCDRTGGSSLCDGLTGRCLISYLGDSVLDAQGSTTYGQSYLSAANLGRVCANTVDNALSGSTTVQLETKWATIDNADAWDAMIWMAGVNDLRDGLDTVANVMTSVDAVLATASAKGMKVLLIGPTPCQQDATCGDEAGADQTRLKDLYTEFASRAAGDADVFSFDAYTAFGDSGDADDLASWCDNGDGIHLSTSCHEWVLAPIVESYILGAAFTDIGIIYENSSATTALSAIDTVVDMDTATVDEGYTLAVAGATASVTVDVEPRGDCYVQTDLNVTFASGTPTVTITVYKEGVATAITGSVAIADTSEHSVSASGSVACSAGDTFDVRAKVDAGTPTMTLVDGNLWSRVNSYPDPVAYFSMDDADFSGTTHLESYSSADGTEHGSSASATGQVNEGRDFTSGHYDVANENAFDRLVTQPLTVATWFKTNSTGGFLTKWDGNSLPGWSFEIFSGSVRFYLINSTATTGYVARTTATTYADDAWHHALITYDGSEDSAGYAIYMDGVSVGTTSLLNTAPGATTNSIGPTIGASRSGGAHSYNQYTGDLDELAFWDVELTPSQARAVYEKGAAGTRLDE